MECSRSWRVSRAGCIASDRSRRSDDVSLWLHAYQSVCEQLHTTASYEKKNSDTEHDIQNGSKIAVTSAYNIDKSSRNHDNVVIQAKQRLIR